MNIFVLGQTPNECAVSLCDQHLNKMILEYTQLLCTAHRVLDGDAAPAELYKATHSNHPCAKWARESANNYVWLVTLLNECLDEYEYRKEKTHGCDGLYRFVVYHPRNIEQGKPLTPLPNCTPYKELDTIAAYRRYYHDKRKEWTRRDNRPIIMTWTKRKPPEWV